MKRFLIALVVIVVACDVSEACFLKRLRSRTTVVSKTRVHVANGCALGNCSLR